MLKRRSLQDLLKEILLIDERGGPQPDEYEILLDLFHDIAELRQCELSDAAVLDARNRMPAFCSVQSLAGFVCLKPHGYAGDFEIIERLYMHYRSNISGFDKWDDFFQAGDAPQAVRGRKDYCIDLFRETAEARPQGARILNIASGPCRDLLEFKNLPGDAMRACHIHCIDADPNAIAYARKLMAAHKDAVSFENRNAFRIRPVPEYDLVWSAGLFDYLDDRAFISLLRRLARSVRPGGELVVGNFAPTLRFRPFMEFGGWTLTYRNEDQMLALARQAGFTDGMMRIGREYTGQNLFLHLRV